MSNRVIRVNELLQREISAYLRKRYTQEMVAVTVSGVEVTSDLDLGTVYVAIIGTPEFAAGKMRWLRRHCEEIRRAASKHVVLRRSPHLRFVLDETPDRAARIMSLLDEIEAKERASGSTEADPAPPSSEQQQQQQQQQ